MVRMLVEELLCFADLEGFAADEVEKESAQEDGFALVGRDGDGVGLGSGLRELGVDFREKLGVGVVVGAAKIGEFRVGKGTGGVWSGVVLEEEERDLGLDVAEEVEGLWVVAQEDGLEAVGVGSDGFGEGIDEVELGLHFLDQLAIGFPGGKAMTVGAEKVGDEEGIGGVVVGAGGAMTRAAGADDTGGNDVDLITARKQEVDEEGVGSLESDETIRGRHIQLVDLVLQLGETLGGVREGES